MGEDESEPHRARDRLSWKLKVYQVHRLEGKRRAFWAGHMYKAMKEKRLTIHLSVSQTVREY